MDLRNNQTLKNLDYLPTKKVGPISSPKAILAIFIFIVTVMPILIFLGVRSQQYNRGSAAGCEVSCGGRSIQDCWSNAGSGCAWSGDPYSGSCYCSKSSVPTPTPGGDSGGGSDQCCSGTGECTSPAQCTNSNVPSSCSSQGKGICRDVEGPPGCCQTDADCSPNESCSVNNGACPGAQKSCTLKAGQCKTGGNSCSENWQCCSGSCSGGKCQGDGGSFTPRPATKVCEDNGGSQSSTCSADPNCGTNGGVCCDYGGKNYCCYGDSSTRQDGSCYLGGASGVACDGNTITNNTTSTVTIKHFSGNDNDRCPISTAGGSNTSLAPGASVSADGCEQIEADGYCGVCDDSSCGGDNPPTTTPSQPSPTPTSQPNPGQCRNIGIYDTSWNPISDLTTLKAGQIVRFTTVGTTGGSYDRGRFMINKSGQWLPSIEGTTQVSPSNEFYYEYAIPTGITSFTIEAMVHETTEGWK